MPIEIKNTIKLQLQLERHEGKHKKWYKDTKGYWTNGVGHKDTSMDDITRDWTDADVAHNFIKDSHTAESGLEKFDWYNQLDDVRKCVLINMVFNMGLTGVLKFKKTIMYITNKEFHQASFEMLDSDWKDDVGPNRSGELSKQMETGQWQF